MERVLFAHEKVELGLFLRCPFGRIIFAFNDRRELLLLIQEREDLRRKALYNSKKLSEVEMKFKWSYLHWRSWFILSWSRYLQRRVSWFSWTGFELVQDGSSWYLWKGETEGSIPHSFLIFIHTIKNNFNSV